MSDFFEFLDVGELDVDIDSDAIPDVHEMDFVFHPDGTEGVPGAIDPGIDMDHDGIPDQVDSHIDPDGEGLDYHVAVDSTGDGMNDWVDPYSAAPGTGLHPDLATKLLIGLENPHF